MRPCQCGAAPRLLHSSQGAASRLGCCTPARVQPHESRQPMQGSCPEWRAQEGAPPTSWCNAPSSPFATGLGPTGPMARLS